MAVPVKRKLAALAEEVRALPRSETKLETFSLGDSLLFARPPHGCSARELHEAFHLSRQHSEALRGLLFRSSGQLHAEKVRFTWSAGLLMAEREARFFGELKISSGGEFAEVASSLGSWKVPREFAEGLNAPAAAQGESAKKEFQALRVPRFFRPAIPLLWGNGGPKALLPRRLTKLQAGIRYLPSPLAIWWMKMPNGESSIEACRFPRE